MPVTNTIPFVKVSFCACDNFTMLNYNLQTFGRLEKRILPMLNPCRLRSTEDLISHLETNEDLESLYDNTAPKINANVFITKFAHYLRGLGHPNHLNIPESVVSAEDQAAAAKNPVFRAEKFLVLATGSELLPPPEVPWTIEVCEIYYISALIHSEL
jgi:hypothetical protein